MLARIIYANVPETPREPSSSKHYIHNSGKNTWRNRLVHLVKMRASRDQWVCVLPLDVHSKDARAPRRGRAKTLHARRVGGEAPFYSERERATLAPTDAISRITEGHAPDAVFERARAHFNRAQELIALVFTLTTVNAWNRLC